MDGEAITMIFLPYTGEFGWEILCHARRVFVEQAQTRIVCCEESKSCLYPTATQIYSDFKVEIPDSNKWRHGPTVKSVNDVILEKFVGEEVFDGTYGCHWHSSDLVKFKPVVDRVLPVVDVVLCPRKRGGRQLYGNWSNWAWLARSLRQAGLRVGSAGTFEQSFPIDADSKGWEHPKGPVQGALDLIYGAKLLVCGDTGIGHLAALVDAPMLVFGAPDRTDLIGVMARANKGKFVQLSDDSWHKRNRILGAIMKELSC